MNNSSIISQINEIPPNSKLVFAIGLGEDENQALRIFRTLEKSQKFCDNCFLLVGEEKIISFIRNVTDVKPAFLDRLGTVLCSDPAKWLTGMLFHFDFPEICPQSPYHFCINTQMGNDFYRKGVDSNFHQSLVIIRGSLGSEQFLGTIQPYLTKFSIKKPVRVALMEDAFDRSFFFGGVGIDEISTAEEKVHFIKRSIAYLEEMEIFPKIAVLSAGRLSDLGRSPEIDHNIQISQQVVAEIKKFYGMIEIQHKEILIESAIADNFTLILPPNGVSGNLIYRTLVHLGKGKAYGAIYADILINSGKVCIDCSRVAPEFEIEGSLHLGNASFYAAQKRINRIRPDE